MRTPRRSRRLLSGDELRLWGEIAKLVTPLRGKAVPAKPAATKTPAVKAPAAEPARPPAKPAAPGPKLGPAPLPGGLPKRPVKLADLAPRAAAPQGPPQTPKPDAPAFRSGPPLSAGLERKERRGLQRGTLEIEARIDLHGLYQAEAHAALIGFIARARAAGHARVLVVTGKGGGMEAGFGDERGVLRRSVPHWLRGPELRGLVLGFEEAGRRHGGGGALYVRLRRR